MMASVKFKAASGDLMGVLMTPPRVAIEWVGPGRVVFSFTQLGEAISAHFSADKKGLRYLKQAIEDFCEWAFEAFDWCRMILAIVGKPSVVRLIKKCGFSHVTDIDDNMVYTRLKSWEK